MRGQRGASGIFVFVLLLFVVVAMVALLTLSRTKTAVDANTQTTTNLANAAAALEQFASASGRLPCPADPTKDDGLASPNGASVNCNFTQGVLPWSTIGMRRDDAYDAWGWKISYRVYSNVNGSLTQDLGASMVNCDTVQALTTRQAVDPATKLCPAAHDTLDTDFISGKGLSVTDFGTVHDGTTATGGAAYILISHGVTGAGAYSAAGVRKDLPVSNVEKNNTKDTGPFTLQAASDPDLGVNDPNHYDDFLLYRTVADLAKRANLAARDWPDDVLAGVKFDQATVQDALGSNPNANGGDAGVSSLSFPYVTVSAFDSGGAQDIGYTGGGNPGLGGVSGGSNNLTSTGGEGLRLDFKQAAGRFAVTLDNFGIQLVLWKEQAEFRFYSAGTLVTTVVKQGCRTDGSNTLASFSINPGVSFDRVEIRPLATTVAFATTFPSSMIVSEIATCTAAASSCKTTLDAANPASECP